MTRKRRIRKKHQTNNQTNTIHAHAEKTAVCTHISGAHGYHSSRGNPMAFAQCSICPYLSDNFGLKTCGGLFRLRVRA